MTRTYNLDNAYFKNENGELVHSQKFTTPRGISRDQFSCTVLNC